MRGCPFCNCEAKVKPIRDGAQVVCPNCFARGPARFHGPKYMDSAHKRAVAAWDSRVQFTLEIEP